MRNSWLAAIVVSGLLLAGFAAAEDLSPAFALKNFRNRADGPDRLFTVKVENVTDQTVYLRGRLVAISVYDTAQPTVIPVDLGLIGSHETRDAELRWVGAPAFGRVRALLVLSGGQRPSLVESFDFWLLPVWPFVQGAAVAVALAVLVIALMRLRAGRHERIPANMAACRAEADDSVVALASRYGVTWQEIVKANRLKPPYTIKPGQRLLIPRHALVRHQEAAKDGEVRDTKSDSLP